MRRIILLFFLLAALAIPGVGLSYTFQDDFNDGDLAGWTSKIGFWSVDGTGDKYLHNTSGNVYGVLWKDDSFGVYQKLQVDAYFDLADVSYNKKNKIAHLRLRTNEHPGTTNPFWDTGYLAQFGLNSVTIQNTYLWGNPLITSYNFTSSPFTSTGWYTLAFGVEGTGADTHFNMWINDVKYIDNYYYDNSIAALDSGYVGLGRLIKYDNVQGYSSSTPVPEPATMLLLGSGLIGLEGFKRKRATGGRRL